MKSNNKHSRRVAQSTKLIRVKTINDLLARDDINGILADLDQKKPNISDMIVIYLDKETQKYHFQITEKTLVSTATWMLESTKLDILNSEDEE